MTRLLLFHLCRTLTAAPPAIDALDVQKDTIARMVVNLFTSWQYTLTAGAAGDHAVVMEVVAAWGALNDFPNLFEPALHASELCIWLLENINIKIVRVAAAYGREMDRLTDLFAGGPITGRVMVFVRELFLA